MILDTAKGWVKNYFAMAFFTGMRSGEIVALEWSDIDWKAGLIHVNKTRCQGATGTPKTRASNRIIPIFDALKDYLVAQYELTGRKSKTVFVNAYGEELWDYKTIREHQWKRLLKECNIKYRKMHDTRSTFTTLALMSGLFNVQQVGAMLGHSDLSTLYKHYAKYIPSEVLKIDRSFGFTSVDTSRRLTVA